MSPDVIIRHPKERKSKCSLQPLVGRPDLHFITASNDLVFDATGYILLDPDGPVLDCHAPALPLILLDSTWRLLPALQRCLIGSPVRYSLPDTIVTAYPRLSKLSNDPANGLASVEALFAARYLLKRSTNAILDHYHWRDAFLRNFFPNS